MKHRVSSINKRNTVKEKIPKKGKGNILDQYHPTELSVVMEMFLICTVQHVRHKSHVAY